MDFIPDNYLAIILRLFLAMLFGGIIGFERAGSNHDAGLRTHILVCLGSACVMIMSETICTAYDGDVMRVGAQVVSGIGFLGAGCILVHGKRIRGLTTAAGLWATACLGLTVGVGHYFVSIVMVLFMLLAMLVLHPITNQLNKRVSRKICRIRIIPKNPEEFKGIYKYITDGAFHITSMEREKDGSVVLSVAETEENAADLIIAAVMGDNDILKIEKI